MTLASQRLVARFALTGLLVGGLLAGLSLSRNNPNAPKAAAGQRDQAGGLDFYGDPLPAGAVARLGSSRFRVGGATRGLAFANGDQSLVTATSESRVVLFDCSTGRLLREIITRPQWIEKMRLTPDRQAVVTVGVEIDVTRN